MSARLGRRQVLATIALADAPAPKAIRFRNDRLGLDVEHVADLLPWGAVFGADPKKVAHKVANPLRFTHSGDHRPMVSSLICLTWRGWEISIDGTEYVDGVVEPLDDTTREQLQAVADGESGETA